ncbi:hypothetical protein CKM354_000412000 [Cercospora kikuchii]|uniref:Pisatin demethylase n=1 Tax=Cercospora kikuchii TaxID=84275 RepID=A0A9P3CDJ9_9PEZI|nr:uncharacterized protein CKM354_000412000 [Cercospora kikuchii]GIZ40796.1 hypothetical protein CKM354_000412000 [Cercospora kikuchii]
MEYHLQLHKKYGKLVRIGPNHVMFSDAALIPPVYGIGSKFMKSNFYLPFDIKTPTGMMSTVFSERDGTAHRGIRRPIANAYALSTLKELEPMNDACSATIVQKFNGLVGQDIDLGTWLHWYAFDTITSITFSNTLGFMEQERDIDRIIESIEGRLMYNSVIGQAPYLHKYLFGSTLVSNLANLIPSLRIMNTSKYIVAFAAKQLQRYSSQDFNTVPLKDMLDRFRRTKDSGEELISDSRMLSHATSNIFAGSDTTAASLRSIFYNLCRNPRAHDTLLSELDSAERNGQLSDPVTFSEAQNLPYLQAVIREALRMHPAVGLLLERVVPPGGFEIEGTGIFLPEGTIIGANPWVMARDEKVYGSDAYEFRPERWLEASPEELKLMERNDFSFGAGARTCLGKNISLLEMSKLVPQLYRQFDFELTDPEKEWELHDYWFVKQTGLMCKVKRRSKNLG